MIRLFASALLVVVAALPVGAEEPAATRKVAPGEQAPAFKIKDAAGKVIDLAELTAKGPVLVRLTCGCAGCDKELAYFQQIHDAYKGQGLTSLFIFKEPDEKVAKYAVEKKLNMLYAVDAKGQSWDVFQTKTMPTNILIDKGGKIAAIAAGCDPSGLLANKVSEKAAKVVGTGAVDVKEKVDQRKADEAKSKK
jgi:peroxiredoxin